MPVNKGICLLTLSLVSLTSTATPNSLGVGVDINDVRLKDMLNTCIDSQNHKHTPGPEDSLHNQCKPWEKRACCNLNTTIDAHYTKMYNFNWHHCSHKQALSQKCTRHFVQDLCFYECSPNVYPWVVKAENKFRKERFQHVPLCRSDCEAWFMDCADDFTCTDNWARNFEWVKGIGNRCPSGSHCDTFRNIYRNASYFCQVVWDYSWKVVPDEEPCMRLWFDGSQGNPNDQVALWKAQKILNKRDGGGVSSAPETSGTSLIQILVIMVAVVMRE